MARTSVGLDVGDRAARGGEESCKLGPRESDTYDVGYSRVRGLRCQICELSGSI